MKNHFFRAKNKTVIRRGLNAILSLLLSAYDVFIIGFSTEKFLRDPHKYCGNAYVSLVVSNMVISFTKIRIFLVHCLPGSAAAGPAAAGACIGPISISAY